VSPNRELLYGSERFKQQIEATTRRQTCERELRNHIERLP
jgi:hypothetical protein